MLFHICIGDPLSTVVGVVNYINVTLKIKHQQRRKKLSFFQELPFNYSTFQLTHEYTSPVYAIA
jgi:hypothetical protein